MHCKISTIYLEFSRERVCMFIYVWFDKNKTLKLKKASSSRDETEAPHGGGLRIKQRLHDGYGLNNHAIQSVCSNSSALHRICEKEKSL